MKDKNNHGKGIFYGVIGVATLVVAIIGATFAYFTAQMTDGQEEITGDMASISFGLQVDKVIDPGETKGLIPLSNSMIEQSVSGASAYAGEEPTNKTCIDDNGNAVCQIYKITVTNESSTTMFVDGYIALKGGSGVVTDYEYETPENNKTTMRWAQVFKGSDQAEKGDAEATYSTAGTTTIGGSSSLTFDKLDPTDQATDYFNQSHILKDQSSIIGQTEIESDSYDAVKANYIRVSDHKLDQENLSTTFDKESDLTSLLVLNRRLMPTSDPQGEDKAEFYFVVWLSETGNNQTAGATPQDAEEANPDATDFFDGIVSFVSAQGGKVTASFSGYTAVEEGTKVGS